MGIMEMWREDRRTKGNYTKAEKEEFFNDLDNPDEVRRMVKQGRFGRFLFGTICVIIAASVFVAAAELYFEFTNIPMFVLAIYIAGAIFGLIIIAVTGIIVSSRRSRRSSSNDITSDGIIVTRRIMMSSGGTTHTEFGMGHNNMHNNRHRHGHGNFHMHQEVHTPERHTIQHRIYVNGVNRLLVAVERQSPYHMGDRVKVKYNPNNPKHCRIVIDPKNNNKSIAGQSRTRATR